MREAGAATFHRMTDAPKRVREGMVVRIYKLGEEPGDDISAETTPEQRIAMVGLLTERMWMLQGSIPCPYTRATIPVKIVRPQ